METIGLVTGLSGVMLGIGYRTPFFDLLLVQIARQHRKLFLEIDALREMRRELAVSRGKDSKRQMILFDV